MRSRPLVVATVCLQYSAQPCFIEDEHVIEAFATDGSDEAFHVSILPGYARCREHLLHRHRVRRPAEFIEGMIAVANQGGVAPIPKVRR
jgi:hypothetical protein